MHATAVRLSLSLSLSLPLTLSLSLSLSVWTRPRVYGHVCMDTWTAVHGICALRCQPSICMSISVSCPLSLSLSLARSRGTPLCAISLRAVPLSSCVRAPRLTRTSLMMTSHPRGASRVRVPPRLFNGTFFELLAGQANGLLVDHLRVDKGGYDREGVLL